jgi:hypothetical protein
MGVPNMGADSAAPSNLRKMRLQNFPAYGNADDKKDQAHHEEEKEQEFCNSRGSRRDAGKSE